MTAPIREFKSLPENLQEKILGLLETYYTFKGHQSPRKRAENYISHKQPKTRKQWQIIAFITMTKIDRQRNKAGLPAVYFLDTPFN